LSQFTTPFEISPVDADRRKNKWGDERGTDIFVRNRRLMLRKILFVFLVLFLAIQFIRPGKNLSGDRSHGIATAYHVPGDIGLLLQKACADCHSNKTNYPWYAEVQPVGWWLYNHVQNGKRHFNLDEFTARRIGYQYKKMDDCIEQLKNGWMPLDSYTWIHRHAILSDAEKQTLIKWCDAVKGEMRLKYPADSLVPPRRGQH
jgi:hypothetical protein